MLTNACKDHSSPLVESGKEFYWLSNISTEIWNGQQKEKYPIAWDFTNI